MAKKPPKAARPKPPYRVFVSHSTADKWLAKVLCERIELTGADFFRDDRDIKGGDNISDAIFEAINSCDELLVLLTPASVMSQWVLVEVGAAAGRRTMPVIGIRSHIGMDPIPAILKPSRVFDLNEFDRYIEELADRVAKGGR